jgi:hypothetical protein
MNKYSYTHYDMYYDILLLVLYIMMPTEVLALLDSLNMMHNNTCDA